jgi:hypothetical protein
MHKNEAMVRTLCRPFCAYYKPGINEELFCRGAVVANSLARSGMRLFLAEKPWIDPESRTTDLMALRLCGACDFRDQDCDFANDRTAQPCGGFLFLFGNLLSGAITLEDIY